MMQLGRSVTSSMKSPRQPGQRPVHSGRRMQVQKSAEPWVRYRCRARDLTPGTLLDHPASVSIGQTAVLQRINPWLTELLRGRALAATVNALVNVVEPPRPDSRVELLRRRENDAREKLRRLVDALALGTFPAESLAGPITAAQADANAARAELDALDAPAEVPGRKQVEQAMAVLGDRVGDVLTEDRSPELLHEFYASIGLSLTWDHSARRLTAKLDLAPAVADLTGQAEPLIHRGVSTVSEGGLEPPCPLRALAPQASASTYSATRTPPSSRTATRTIASPALPPNHSDQHCRRPRQASAGTCSSAPASRASAGRWPAAVGRSSCLAPAGRPAPAAGFVAGSAGRTPRPRTGSRTRS